MPNGRLHVMGGAGPGLTMPRIRIFPLPGARGERKFPKPPKDRPTDWVTPSSEFGDLSDVVRDYPIDITAGQWKVKDLVDLGTLAKGYPFWQDGRVQIIGELFNRVRDGRIKVPEFLAAVLPFLSNNEQHTKEYVHINEAVILLIRTIEDFSVLKDLAQGPLLKSPDSFVRRGIAEGLGYSSKGEIVPYLAAALKDSDPKVRLEIIRAMENLRDPAGVKVAMVGLKDADPEVRAAAIDALVALGAKDQVEAIKGLVRDGVGFVRGNAFQALGALDPEGSVSLIATGLKDATYEGKIGAMRGLFAARSLLMAEEIAGLLKDESWEVRKTAMRTLWFMRAKPTVRLLIDALRTEKVAALRDLLHQILLDMLNDAKGTGAGDLGADKDAWKDWIEWWEKNQARWNIPAQIGEYRISKEAPTMPGTASGLKKRKYTFDLHGDVAFILDLSGGMGRAGKLAMATNAIAGLIDEFPVDAYFTVLAWQFGGKFVQPPPGDGRSIAELPTQLATHGNKSNARKKLGFVTAGGWTPLYAPLKQAINDRRILTVLYVTDGGANRDIGGNYGVISGSNERLWMQVKRLLRYHPVQLNGLNVRGREDFVDQMAETGLGVADTIR